MTDAEYEAQIDALNLEIVVLRRQVENLEGRLSRAAIAERIVREPNYSTGTGYVNPGNTWSGS